MSNTTVFITNNEELQKFNYSNYLLDIKDLHNKIDEFNKDNYNKKIILDKVEQDIQNLSQLTNSIIKKITKPVLNNIL